MAAEGSRQRPDRSGIPLPFALAYALIPLIFVFDLSMPLGYAGGMPYVVPVALCLWAPRSRDILSVGVLTSALTVLGFFLSANGSALWIVLINRAGAIVAVWTVTALVWRYKQMQRAAERYLEVAEVILVALDRHGRVTLINDKGCSVLGCEKEEIIGENWFDRFLPVPVRQEVTRFFDLLMAGEVELARHVENPVLARDGTERLIAWQNEVIRDKSGQVSGTLSSGSDITEARRVQSSLQESEARLEAIVSTAADGIITFDEEGTIETANIAASRVFGYEPGRLAGRNAQALMRDLEQREGPRASDSAQAGTEATSRHRPQEITARRADGSTFPAEVMVSTIRLGERDLFTAIIRDITERKEIELAKDEFVGIASHELRTPLTSIRGALGLLEAGVMGALAPRAQEAVQVACRNSERLIRLVDSLLDLEKARSGKIDLQVDQVGAAELVNTTLAALAGMAEQGKVDLDGGHFSPDLYLRCDKDRVVQVLTNLVGNAIKFSSAGTTVKVRCSEEDAGRVRLSVVDNGPGIAEEHQTQLFDKFYQIGAHNIRRKGGTGLGLAISRAIVEQHGGTIGVESELGKGATFFFTLQRAPQPQERLTAGRQTKDDGQDAQRLS